MNRDFSYLRLDDLKVVCCRCVVCGKGLIFLELAMGSKYIAGQGYFKSSAL